MKKPELIQKKIECERVELYRMESLYGGMLHPKVIKQSMKLDKLINNYYRAVYSAGNKL
jgi:hypothetical protein